LGYLTPPGFPFNKTCWLTFGSQPVNKAKTNCSYLTVNTRKSTERLEDLLVLWSAVKIKALCYMWVVDKGEAARRGRGNTV
jgi:hypothetical protein